MTLEEAKQIKSKKCNTCHENKDIVRFKLAKVIAKSGREYYRYESRCKDCANSKQKERYDKKREEMRSQKPTTLMKWWATVN